MEKKNNNKYVVTFEFTYKLEGFGSTDNRVWSHLSDKIEARDLVDAYEKAIELMNKINACNKDMLYTLGSIDRI